MFENEKGGKEKKFMFGEEREVELEGEACLCRREGLY